MKSELWITNEMGKPMREMDDEGRSKGAMKPNKVKGCNKKIGLSKDKLSSKEEKVASRT